MQNLKLDDHKFSKTIFITGGTKSGKSEFAEYIGRQNNQLTYIALSDSRPNDRSWQRKILLHQQRRPNNWKLVETTDLISLLHPTPAVAGMPKNLAISYINRKEDYNRTFYSGFLGFLESKSCDIYVNIRCAKIIDDDLTIYVGGGITNDSNAVDEWHEILNKSQTMLGIFHQC